MIPLSALSENKLIKPIIIVIVSSNSILCKPASKAVVIRPNAKCPIESFL